MTNLPITTNPNILGGTPVFKNTRVPLKTLFDYLENDYTLEEFLDCFPSVTREVAISALDNAWKLEYDKAMQCAS
ncbi:MAG: DUF433 domain-containing protein [Ignavibacteria bacterium]|nr:DUF433 domain-containing protein [Ignavibacteria bacterium]